MKLDDESADILKLTRAAGFKVASSSSSVYETRSARLTLMVLPISKAIDSGNFKSFFHSDTTDVNPTWTLDLGAE